MDRGQRRQRLQAHRQPQARRGDARAGRRHHPEHHDAAQPRQRSRRRRAGDPAARQRPRRRRAARRAGHGQGQRHHRPHGDDRYVEQRGLPIVVKRQVILTGESLTDAQPGFDENHQPAVHLTVDAKGARIMRDISRENIGKRMAILLFEKGKGEVVTAPVIRSELGSRFQISGSMTTAEANDTALLLRAGSLAAPMEIIDERTIGPSLGAENIAKGMQSVMYGFAAIAVFMCVYYLLFGLISTLALAFNLLLLVAVLSMLQATRSS